MWHKMWDGLRRSILTASEYAEQRGDRDIATLHLLWGLAANEDDTAAVVLKRVGLEPAALQEAIKQSTPCEKPARVLEPTLTPEARMVVERAYDLVVEAGDGRIGGEHLLMAMVAPRISCDAGRLLVERGMTWERLWSELLAYQTFRTTAPEGISVPDAAQRKLRVGAKRLRERAGQLTYAAKNYNKEPFLPYLVFRKRTVENPYPFYERLRKQPFYWDTLINQWVVTGYKDVVAVLQEPRFSHQQFSLEAWNGTALPPLIEREFRRLDGSISRQMLFMDAPRQTRLRSLVGRQFTPRVIAKMREEIAAVTDDLLAAPAAAGKIDIIAQLARPLPATVIARLLGVSESDNDVFVQWSDDFITYIGGDTKYAQDLAAYRSLGKLTDYFRKAIAQRRESPTDDLISLLINAEDRGAQTLDAGSGAEIAAAQKLPGDRLTEEEIIANCLLMLAAGHETTTQLIGNGLLALLRNPGQMQKLRQNPELIGPAIEELLRYDSPVQWTSRVTREDFEWNSRKFEKGQMVSIGLASANRDPAQFADPDRLDIERQENRHVAFGYGPHFCLGAALARLEGQIALEALIQRFPHLSLVHDRSPATLLSMSKRSPSTNATDRVKWKGNFTFRALTSLPVILK